MDRFYWLQAIVILCSFITGIVSYVKNPIRDKLVILPVYCLLSFLTTSISTTSEFKHNPILINIFTIFEFFIFSFLFTKILPYKKIKKVFSVFTILFVILSVNALYHLRISVTHVMLILILAENLIMTIYCLIYFHSLVNNGISVNDNSNATSSILTGVALYFCLTTPYYIFYNTLDLEIRLFLYIINCSCNIIMHCFFIKGFLCRLKKI